MRDASVREALTQEQWDRIFHGCPGAWAGNKPELNQPGGIVIDGKNIVAAVRYLNRNRLRVLAAKAPLPEIWCSDGGIVLVIGLR
jgi:hypothetical protein